MAVVVVAASVVVVEVGVVETGNAINVQTLTNGIQNYLNG